MAKKKETQADALIREVVELHIGGMNTATDEQIQFTWDQLDAETKKQWMDAAKGGNDATGDGPGGDLPDRTEIGPDQEP